MKKFSSLLVMVTGLYASLFASIASAALPVGVTDSTTGAFAVITTDYNTLFNDYIWPLVILGTTTWIVIGLFQKGANKAVK